MNTLTHSIFSQDLDQPIAYFTTYNKEDIRNEIKEHLTKYPTDTLEHCREYNKKSEPVKGQYGTEIINFYAVNPKNNKPSLIVTRNNKEYYKSI
jgi:hypothetical protein